MIHTEELQATQSFSLMPRQEYKAKSDDPSGNIRQGSRRSESQLCKIQFHFQVKPARNLLRRNGNRQKERPRQHMGDARPSQGFRLDKAFTMKMGRSTRRHQGKLARHKLNNRNDKHYRNLQRLTTATNPLLPN